MAKKRLSHDQKRKAKLAKRAEKKGPMDTLPQPYEGERYRHDRWIPHVYATESGIYETIQLSRRQLTNEQVHAALIQLIKYLRRGQPILLPEGTPDLVYSPDKAVEYIMWNIRRHWGELFTDVGPVARDDLDGILRTLLFSMEAQAWDRPGGYVDFLYHFMQGGI